MKRFLFNLIFINVFIFGSAVQAEMTLEDELFRAGVWRVKFTEWSDGNKQCVAENLQGERHLDIVVGLNTVWFGIYIGQDVSQSDLKLGPVNT